MNPLSTGRAIPNPYTPAIRIPDVIGANIQTKLYHYNYWNIRLITIVNRTDFKLKPKRYSTFPGMYIQPNLQRQFGSQKSRL